MKTSNSIATTTAYQPMDISGKTVLITGGTTGIGLATAQLLVACGARVMIFGRHEPQLADALAYCKRENKEGEIHGLTADSSRKEDIERVFAAVDHQLGGLDILVNNAALAYNSIMEGSYDDWQYIVNTNLLGYMACAQQAVQRMRDAGGGHIVNIGSMSADVREKNSSVYVATKAGVQGFSEALRKEVNQLGIKVTLIEPGAVGTDMQADIPPDKQREKEEQLEMLKAEDIAACVLYTITQPPRCDVVTVQIRPHLQII
ncbi:MAG TPA: SDR family oxidoreductase [Chitinophaga sp.]